MAYLVGATGVAVISFRQWPAHRRLRFRGALPLALSLATLSVLVTNGLIFCIAAAWLTCTDGSTADLCHRHSVWDAAVFLLGGVVQRAGSP